MYQRHTVKTELTPTQLLERELLKPKLILPSFPDAALRVRKVLEDALMQQFHSKFGRRILESWGFSESLCTAPELYHAITDESDRPADLADIVAVAKRQTPGAEGESNDIQPIPALRRLNLDPETCSEFIQEYTTEIDSLVAGMDSK